MTLKKISKENFIFNFQINNYIYYKGNNHSFIRLVN